MRPGLRDELISQETARALVDLAAERVARESLDPAHSSDRISTFLRAAIQRVMSGLPEADRPRAQAELANRLLELADSDERLELPPALLTGVLPLDAGGLSGVASFRHGHRSRFQQATSWSTERAADYW